MTARRPPFALVLAALVAGAVFWSLGGLEPYDESWFLQVSDRVAGGETLYKDVAYGATPLAVYLTLPLVWLFGAQILWVKALVVGCFAASLLLLVSIGRRIGATNLELAAAGAALLVWSPPIRAGLYQPLATMLLLAALAATLAWRDGRAARTLALAGALAGLSFAAKQNVGAYAAVAVLAAALAGGGSGRVRAAALASGTFATTVVLTLVPVLATGGLRGFWDYGFASKGEYVDRGGISYADGIESQLYLVRYPVHGVVDAATAVVHAYELAVFVLVPVILLALAAAWLRTRGEDRARIAVVGAFSLAAAVAIFPRADTAHVSFVFPVLLVGALCACKALVEEAHLRTAAAVLLAVLAPVVLARGLWPVAQLAQGTVQFSGLPHTRGVLVEPAVETELANAAAALRREPGPVFAATSQAGILYLVSGLENPTPFDYPLVSAFGRDGEERLAADVERGRFAAVCVDFGTDPAVVPTRLAAAIERSLAPAEDLGVCRVYRRSPR
jgi:hypothetical protein